MIASIVKSFIHQRIARLQEKMEELGLGGAIIYKPENVFYFSHFNPVLNSTPVFLFVPCRGESVLLVHCIRYSHALEEGGIDRVVCYGKWGSAPSLAMDPFEGLKKICGKVSVLGLELDSLEVAKYNQIINALAVDRIYSLSEEIFHMKLIKDSYEIDCIRKAARLVDEGVRVTIDSLKKGLSEADACTEGQYAMRKLWGKDYKEYEIAGFGTSEGGMTDSLQVWCLSNEHIAYGCDCSRFYVPKEGDISLPMAWAKLDGYHAENERTCAKGELSGIRKRALNAVLAARKEVFPLVKPGVSFEKLYLTAMDVFTEYGFGDILPGRIGHGVGNSAHEFPSVTKGNQLLLMPGMVITIEPGLMDAGWGGARHSDTVLITENGMERLTTLDNGWISF